jgi:Bacterial protein of unknown function (DUF853)
VEAVEAVRTLPEVGDLDKPKLLFFFDEAHLLFEHAPTALVERIEPVVRLVRSKGVGAYFVTQNQLDVPDTVLGQLGNRVQHALRALTPRDQTAVKAAAETMRAKPGLDVETAITELAVGEALVSLLDDKGREIIRGVQGSIRAARATATADAQGRATLISAPVAPATVFVVSVVAARAIIPGVAPLVVVMMMTPAPGATRLTTTRLLVDHHGRRHVNRARLNDHGRRGIHNRSRRVHHRRWRVDTVACVGNCRRHIPHALHRCVDVHRPVHAATCVGAGRSRHEAGHKGQAGQGCKTRAGVHESLLVSSQRASSTSG